MTSGTGSAHWQLGLLQQLIELADPNNTSESEDHKVAVFEMGAKLYVTLLLGSVTQSAASVSAAGISLVAGHRRNRSEKSVMVPILPRRVG